MEPYHMAYLKLPFLQNWKSTKLGLYNMASVGLLILQNWKSAKLGLLPHGISGDAVLVDHHQLPDSCPILYLQTIPPKRTNLEAFSSVKSEIQQNTNGLLKVARQSLGGG